MSEHGTRRDFIRTGAVAGGALVAAGLRAPAVHAAGSDAIGVGLIGCGGRGRGAAADAVKSSPGVRVVAIGDAFADRVAEARERLKELGEAGAVPERARVRRARRLPEGDRDAGVNYVILATPPGFRPTHLRGRRRRRQEHLHREARGGRRPRHPLGARELRGGQGEGPRDRRRHPAPPRAGLRRGDEAHPRRRHRRDRRRARLLEPGRRSGTSRASRAGATSSGRCATGSTSPGSRATTSSSSTSTTSTSSTGRSAATPCARWAWAGGSRGSAPSTATASTTSRSTTSTRAACTRCRCAARSRTAPTAWRRRSSGRRASAELESGAKRYELVGGARLQVHGQRHEPVRPGAHRPHRRASARASPTTS